MGEKKKLSVITNIRNIQLNVTELKDHSEKQIWLFNVTEYDLLNDDQKRDLQKIMLL